MGVLFAVRFIITTIMVPCSWWSYSTMFNSSMFQNEVGNTFSLFVRQVGLPQLDGLISRFRMPEYDYLQTPEAGWGSDMKLSNTWGGCRRLVSAGLGLTLLCNASIIHGIFVKSRTRWSMMECQISWQHKIQSGSAK